jgi:hypothetical protein
MLFLLRRDLKREIKAIFAMFATLHRCQVNPGSLCETEEGEIHWELFNKSKREPCVTNRTLSSILLIC